MILDEVVFEMGGEGCIEPSRSKSTQQRILLEGTAWTQTERQKSPERISVELEGIGACEYVVEMYV